MFAPSLMYYFPLSAKKSDLPMVSNFCQKMQREILKRFRGFAAGFWLICCLNGQKQRPADFCRQAAAL